MLRAKATPTVGAYGRLCRGTYLSLSRSFIVPSRDGRLGHLCQNISYGKNVFLKSKEGTEYFFLKKKQQPNSCCFFFFFEVSYRMGDSNPRFPGWKPGVLGLLDEYGIRFIFVIAKVQLFLIQKAVLRKFIFFRSRYLVQTWIPVVYQSARWCFDPQIAACRWR